MNLSLDLINQLQNSLTRLDLPAFAPELVLCGAIVVMLLMRLVSAFDGLHLGWVALAATLAAFWVSWRQWDTRPQPIDLFTGLLVYDQFTIFLRLFLFGFTALVIGLTLLTGIPDAEDSADFHCLLLGSTVGMSLMASSNHLLMVFMAIEMASLPSYALAGFLKGKRQASEASLKYVVYGGGASGIMLYGISLLAGRFHTAYLPEVAAGFTKVLATPGAATNPENLILVLGTLFVLIGIGFKLAAVPFHFWCPDVFEGAAAEVAGFLSVGSKGAALALLGRFALSLAGPVQTPDSSAWLHMAQYLVPALAVFAAVTATFGNLAAYMQTNLKRLLAYSTIAHAGYMMMGLATLRTDGVSAVLFYLIVYLFMNLGAFAVVAFLRNQTGSEDLSSYRGLIRRSPCMVLTLAVFLLSLLGMPPLAGFIAKFQIFSALYDAGNASLGESPRLAVTMFALLVVGGLNTVLSVFYYIKVLKVMILDTPLEEVEGRTPAPLAEPVGAVAYTGVFAAVIVALGIVVNPLVVVSQQAAASFRKVPEAIKPPARAQTADPAHVANVEGASRD